MKLKTLIKMELTKEDSTIPSLCNKLGLNDEYEILKMIGELETENKITLKGFNTIYLEDGGAIHLAIYGIYNKEQDSI